jgi:TPR repeat protein
MAATNLTAPLNAPNRRRRVRHKIQTPAYASFTTESKGSMLELHEIVDVSEEGIAIQCQSPLDVDTTVDLCLDLADCPDHIFTTGQVVWTNESGRAGLRFSELPADSLSRLREWLFVNVMAGIANSEVDVSSFSGAQDGKTARPNYTDTLAAVTVAQRQVEALGSDLTAALQLIAERAQVLVRASGAAIALSDATPESMACRASAGSDAPPIGARLQVGSGFSGECVKSGLLLRCDDTELDARVDRESCRALGIRSILAAPVRADGKSIGLVEAFSGDPDAFSHADGRVLQRFAETVLAAVNRAARAEDLNTIGETSEKPFLPPQGSVLFAKAEEEESKKAEADEKSSDGISLPRTQLIILALLAGSIFMALGYHLAPWIQSDAGPWIKAKIHTNEHTHLSTVLASTEPPKPDLASAAVLSVETASLDQLRQMALQGDPAAENALGLRYATGDGIKLSESDAIAWFIKAAEQGNVSAQSKLGSIYFSGRGVPQDTTRAYFWMVVARLSGDDASKTLSPFVRARLTRPQVNAIELDADKWLQQHHPFQKPAAGQPKNRL